MVARAPHDEIGGDRPSGIPPKGKLGASRGELIALMIAVAIFALIVLAFVYESSL
jgi:hypothetical protein